MPGLTPNFAEFTPIVTPTGANFLVGYNTSGSSYIRVPISGLTASYAVFTPLNNQPPLVNYATLNTRNSIAMLDFDESTSQSGMFVSSMPYSANLSAGARVDIKWVGATGVGDCIWGARIMPLVAASNVNTDSFATATTGLGTTATAGLTTTTTLLLNNLSGLAGGDSYRLNIYRVAADASDTLPGFAEVHTVVFRGA